MKCDHAASPVNSFFQKISFLAASRIANAAHRELGVVVVLLLLLVNNKTLNSRTWLLYIQDPDLLK